jgi:SAM-dependent methyltransferase
MSSVPRFDTDDVFDADYLYFYDTILTDDVSDRQVDTLWRVLQLQAGTPVLDLACGHGRIANRLAARGAMVTGLDATPLFLGEARRDAQARGVEVDYVEGDMRDLPWRDRFDAVISVFTSFGYFDDATNRRVLEQVRDVLKPGGRFCLELNNLAWLFANFREQHVTERDGNWMIDRTAYDPLTGRAMTSRTVIRDGQQRTFEFSVRMFTFAELRHWLVAAGFTDVAGYSGRGEELTVDTPRMMLVALA